MWCWLTIKCYFIGPSLLSSLGCFSSKYNPSDLSWSELECHCDIEDSGILNTQISWPFSCLPLPLSPFPLPAVFVSHLSLLSAFLFQAVRVLSLHGGVHFGSVHRAGVPLLHPRTVRPTVGLPVPTLLGFPPGYCSFLRHHASTGPLAPILCALCWRD